MEWRYRGRTKKRRRTEGGPEMKVEGGKEGGYAQNCTGKDGGK